MKYEYQAHKELESFFFDHGFDANEIRLDTSKIHRFKRKNSKKNAWTIGWTYSRKNGGLFIYCEVGDWSTSESYVFQTSFAGVPEVELAEIKRAQTENKKKYELLMEEGRLRAKKLAQYILDKAVPGGDHLYLQNKKIKAPRGVKIYKGMLAIPMIDIDSILVGVQLIRPDGEKFFLKGQQVVGAFFVFGDLNKLEKQHTTYFCEGVATGATIFEAAKSPVICAFNASNLVHVTRAIAKKFKFLARVMCADNDQFTEGNPGVAAATKAAQKYNSKFCKPEFVNLQGRPTILISNVRQRRN
jgi:putative DNA primase/helicase